MIQLFPCNDGSKYIGCDNEKKEGCQLCYKDVRGEARVCMTCLHIEYCLEQSEAYRKNRGKRPRPIIFCSSFLFKRKLKIEYYFKAWRDIPSKERGICYEDRGGGGGNNDSGFSDKDMEIFSDKDYLDRVLIPQRLDEIEKKIVVGVKADVPINKIAETMNFTPIQVRRRYKKILEKLAWVAKKPTRNMAKPITEYKDQAVVDDCFARGEEKYRGYVY